jgi:aryl-alcohol dehydrogenase-like predicted oxidoreductase
MVTGSDTFDLDGETTVHRMGFGAMRLCGPDIVGPPDDEDAARSVLRRAVELGVDFVDTADSYGPGVDERLIRETLDLGGEHSDVTVATKAGLLRNADGDWIPHGDPDYVRNQVLVSRDRLGVETIDLYQYHRPDPDVDFLETVTTFGELKDEGFVRHVGLSNVSVEQLDLARDHVEVATVQNRYNVADREHEDVLEACEDYGVGFMPYFPLAPRGFGGKREAVGAVADAHDATPEQVALAWLLDRSPVTLPIPGTSSREHLEENLAAARLELTDEDRERLGR